LNADHDCFFDLVLVTNFDALDTKAALFHQVPSLLDSIYALST
jgi:hypothetical protein